MTYEKKENNTSENQSEEALNQQDLENIKESIQNAIKDDNSMQSQPELSLEDEILELRDKNLRLLAEMQNLRIRQQKDIKEAREFAISAFAHDMITVLENLNRAQEQIPHQDDEIYKKLVEGLNITRDEVFRILSKHGIERVAPKAGDAFDYKIHQAIVQIPTNEIEEGKIVQLVNAGYTIKERILKPAMVAVAKSVPVANEDASKVA